MKNNKLGVALVKEACFVCGTTVESIIMNKILTESLAEKVEDLHGKVVGFLEEPCDSCKDWMTKGVILVGYIEEKTDDKKNPYRSGDFTVITEDAYKRIFNKELPPHNFVFLEEEVGVNLKLFKTESNEEE